MKNISTSSVSNIDNLVASVNKTLMHECKCAASTFDDQEYAYDEFYGAALIAVYHAAKNFDAESGNKFAAYAGVCIKNSIIKTRNILLNKGGNCGLVMKAVQSYKEEFGITPTIVEIQDWIQDEEGITLRLDTIAKVVKTETSLDSTQHKSYSDDKARPLCECIADGNEFSAFIPNVEDVRWAIKVLCRNSERRLNVGLSFFVEGIDKPTICKIADCSLPTVDSEIRTILATAKQFMWHEAAQVFIDFLHSNGFCLAERGRAA